MVKLVVYIILYRFVEILYFILAKGSSVLCVKHLFAIPEPKESFHILASLPILITIFIHSLLITYRYCMITVLTDSLLITYRY